MLVKVGPYDFKEDSPAEASAPSRGCSRPAGPPGTCSVCGEKVASKAPLTVGTLSKKALPHGKGLLARSAGDVDAEPGESPLVERSGSPATDSRPLVCCNCQCAMASCDDLEPGLEHLRNGVAVGTFELPPIPLARLPETKQGLPAKREPTKDPRQADKSGKSHRPRNFHSTHGGRPLCDYDQSNCQPHTALDASIPPLPPSACRLPQRTERELRTQRALDDVTLVVESRGTPFPNVVIVWTTASASLAKSSGHTRRLQQGTPILLSFVNKEDAKAAYDALLKHRSNRLDEWTSHRESSRVPE